jgi:hypothetical protein
MKCESCEKEYPDAETVVASVPGVPYSACYCLDCIGKNSHPMWAVVATTASCGGLDNMRDEWKHIVTDSLAAQGKTMEWFLERVKENVEALENYEPPTSPMPDAEGF